MESNNVNQREDSCSYGLSLTGELQQGKEFARQLQMLLHNDAPPHQAREFLVQQIIGSFDRAVSIAHQTEPLAPSPPPPPLLAPKSDSPLSGGGATSPRSEDSDPIEDLQDSRTRNKAAPRWKMNVQVSPETGFEGPPGDGYNWRKYGQKEILHADYPRAYYRCALKNQTSCPATKQVQRCDKDPSTFEVTYRGLHTCNHPPPSSSHPNPNLNQGPGPGKETLISFNPPNNPCFILHNQQLPTNPNPSSFQFHATSSGPTTATSAVMPATTSTAAVGATSSLSATSSPINITHDFPFDQFDFNASEFFH